MAYRKAASSSAWTALTKAFDTPETTSAFPTVFTAVVPDDLSGADKALLTEGLVDCVQLILDAANAHPPASRPGLGSGFAVKFAAAGATSPALVAVHALHKSAATALQAAHAADKFKVINPTGLELSLSFTPSQVKHSPFDPLANQSYKALIHGFPEHVNEQLLKPAITEHLERNVQSVSRVLKKFKSGSLLPTNMVNVTFKGATPKALGDALTVIELDNGLRLPVTYPSIPHLDSRPQSNRRQGPPPRPKAPAASSKGKERERDESHRDAAPISDSAPKESESVRPHSSASHYGTPLLEVPSEPVPTPSGQSASCSLSSDLASMPGSGAAVPPGAATSPASAPSGTTPDDILVTSSPPGSGPPSRSSSPTSVKRPPGPSDADDMSDSEDKTDTAPPAHRARCTSVSPPAVTSVMDEDTGSPTTPPADSSPSRSRG